MTSQQHELSNRVFTVPNLLSVSRLIGVPFFVWLIMSHKDSAALIVLMVAGFTDYLDGKIARQFNMESRLGAMLDPIADRLYTVATIVCLSLRDILPLWVIFVLVLRDLTILAMSRTVRRHKLPLPPVHFIGKAATFNLLYAFPLLLLADGSGIVADVAKPVAWAFAMWGLALYWCAGVLYWVQIRAMVRQVTGGPIPQGHPDHG